MEDLEVKDVNREDNVNATDETLEVANVLDSMRHKHEAKLPPYKLRLRNWLNSIFILLALATGVLYFVYPLPKGQIVIFATCSLAIMVKMVEVTIRMTHKRPATRSRKLRRNRL